MAEILMEYALFLAKAVTIVVAVGLTVALIAASVRRERTPERLEVKHLNERYEAMTNTLRKETLSKKAFKAKIKLDKARKKAEQKREKMAGDGVRPRVFILNFHGDIKATAVSSLREEVTAVLLLARTDDEVAVRLENTGGLVHEHGLAASQLMRIKEKKIPLTIMVDKVAASGGYMMACVADRILAAPFAVLGSIGVLAQLPNFHRLLENHGIDVEQFMAGEFKRTVTLFGRNSDEGRAKLKEELEDTHRLFKDFVTQHRPKVEIEHVATGEHWYGTRALELKLVDRLVTSDDYLLEASQRAELYEVTYAGKRSVTQRVASMIQQALEQRLTLGSNVL
ncbi:MAG: protease SohB [Gammaproteobacteria bacterium]